MIPENPLVSIGLVTFNRGSIIHHAIDQLLGQTYKNIELIISDNASTDETQQVCEAYAKKDRRVRYIRQEKNIGMYPNFNYVLEHANGDLFLWATDDDEWENTYLEQMVALHKKYDNIVVANSNYTSFSDTHSFDTPYRFPEYNAPLPSVAAFLPSGAVITYGVHRIEAIRKTGGFYIYPAWIPQGIGEIILLYRILLQGSVGFIQKPLWKKRDSGYTFEKYDVLQKLSFSSPIVFRIIRYLKFPLLFLYDLVIQLQDTWKSSYSFGQKILLSLLCLRHYVLNMFEFVLNVVKGCVSILIGLGAYIMKVFSHKE